MLLTLPKKLQKLLLISLVLFGTVSVVLTFVEAVTFPNYVYSTFYIQYDQIGLIALALGVMYVSTIKFESISRNLSSVLFYSAPLLVTIFVVMRFWPRDFFLKMVQEDHFIENAQFVVLVTGAIMSWYLSYFLKKRNQAHSMIFGFVAGCLFLVAGDEISWGQRIFSIMTPDFIGSQNTQNEITIHNNYRFDGFVKWGYMLVGFYGAYAWLLFRYFPTFDKIPSLFVPYWFTTWFFFSGFIYNFYTLLPGHGFGEWSEIAELMLYLGIMLHLALVYFRLKGNKL